MEKIWEQIKSIKSYIGINLVVAGMFFVLGKCSTAPPKVEQEKLVASGAKESGTTAKIKAKIKKPDGTEIDIDADIYSFLKENWNLNYEKKVTTNEPEWLVAVSVASSLEHLAPTYGASLGYKIISKTYAVGTVWPQEMRAEASLIRLID